MRNRYDEVTGLVHLHTYGEASQRVTAGQQDGPPSSPIRRHHTSLNHAVPLPCSHVMSVYVTNVRDFLALFVHWSV